MSQQTDEYHEQCRQLWVDAIHAAVGRNPPTTSIWRGAEVIEAAVQPFVDAVNHLHLASGGGYDIQAVTTGPEAKTIIFQPRERLDMIARVRAMTLEYIAADPAESFLTFDLDALEPSGVYEDVESPFMEEIIEVSRGVFAPRSAWDDGFYDRDEDGNEIPLPETARQVFRCFQGRLLMVTKGSRWIRSKFTYAGEHNYLSNASIRAQIERGVFDGTYRLDPAPRASINARGRGLEPQRPECP